MRILLTSLALSLSMVVTGQMYSPTDLNVEKDWLIKIEPNADYDSYALKIDDTGKQDVKGKPVYHLVFVDKEGKPVLTLRPDFSKVPGAYVDYHPTDPRIYIIVSPEMLAQVHRPDEDAYYAFLDGSFYTKKGERKYGDIMKEYFEKVKIDGTRNTRDIVDLQKQIADYLENEYKQEVKESNKEKAAKFKSGVYDFYQYFGTKGVSPVDKYTVAVEWVDTDKEGTRLNGIRLIKADRAGNFGEAADRIFLEYDADRDLFVNENNEDEKWVIYHGRLMRASKYNTVEGILVEEDKSIGDDYFVLKEKTYGWMKPTKTRYREDVGESHYKGEEDKAYFSYWFSRYVGG